MRAVAGNGLIVRPAMAAHESLRGYMERLFRANGYVNAQEGFEDFKGQREQRSLPAAERPAALCRALDLRDEDRLVLAIAHAMRKGKRSRPYRFCVQCVADAPFEREAWTSPHAAVCHVHGTYLTDCCPRCNEQLPPLTALYDWRCQCRRMPAEHRPVRAPGALVGFARDVERRANWLGATRNFRGLNAAHAYHQALEDALGFLLRASPGAQTVQVASKGASESLMRSRVHWARACTSAGALTACSEQALLNRLGICVWSLCGKPVLISPNYRLLNSHADLDCGIAGVSRRLFDIFNRYGGRVRHPSELQGSYRRIAKRLRYTASKAQPCLL